MKFILGGKLRDTNSMVAFSKRGIEETIGNASSFARWILDHTYGDTSSGMSVNSNSALTLPYVYACINVLAQTLANVPLELLRDTAKGPRRQDKHPLYNMMKWSVSSEQTSYKWRETMEGHRNGWGNAYTEIVRDGPFPVELRMMLPDRTEPRRLAADRSLIYEVRDGTSVQQLPAVDVLHFSGLGFDGMKGYSPIHQAAEAIGLGMAIHKFGGTFFGNGMSPKAVIESDVAPNTLAPFLEEFKKQFGGLERSNGVPVLPRGLTYKPITINPDDAQTLETLKYNRTEICGMFRVPPQFIMDLDRSTFTNAVEMDLHFLKHSMIPIFTNWEHEMNRKLLTESERKRGFYFKFNVNGILRGAPQQRYNGYHLALQDGWLSRNEVRKLEDLEEGPEELDEYLTPTNMAPSTSEETPDEEPAEEPLVNSIAERMASYEGRELERAGEDIEKVSDVYQRFPAFISRTALPTARMLESGLNCTSDEFVAKFAARYIEKQLQQMVDRVGDVQVSEQNIVDVFYEVKDEWTN